MTRHVRHIFTQGDQTEQKYSCHAINMLIVTFQSHPEKMGCCNTITQCLIVTTINPTCRSRPVCPGTNFFYICSLKSKEHIIFAHNYYF